MPLSRWNETLIAVSDCSLLNEQSYKKCREDSLSAKQRLFKGVTGNNLMITLYFSCLLECTELLIDIFSLAAFLKSHSEMAVTNWLKHLIYFSLHFLDISVL